MKDQLQDAGVQLTLIYWILRITALPYFRIIKESQLKKIFPFPSNRIFLNTDPNNIVKSIYPESIYMYVL